MLWTYIETKFSSHIISAEIAKLKSKKHAIDIIELTNPSREELNSEIHVQPLFSQFRLLIVRGLKNLTDTTASAALFINKAPECHLVLVIPNFGGKTKISDACKENGKVTKYPAPTNTRGWEKYYNELFNNAGITMKGNLTKMVLSYVGEVPEEVINVIARLKAQNTLSPTQSQLVEVLPSREKDNPYEFFPHLFNSDTKKFNHLLTLLRFEGADERIMNMLNSWLLSCVETKSTIVNNPAFQPALSYQQKRIKKLIRNVPLDELAQLSMTIQELLFAQRSNKDINIFTVGTISVLIEFRIKNNIVGG